MTGNSQTPMQKVIQAILQRHNLIDTFDTAADFHLRIENEPYLPLIIERHGSEVSVAHHFSQNGDSMRDPELTFALPGWLPTSITQDPVGRYACVDDLPQGSRQSRKAGRQRARLLADLTSFARTWARNIQAQGFADEDVKAFSLTHQAVLDCRTQKDDPAPDTHLEVLDEDRFVSDYEDYEPSPYDGTYSEE